MGDVGVGNGLPGCVGVAVGVGSGLPGCVGVAVGVAVGVSVDVGVGVGGMPMPASMTIVCVDVSTTVAERPVGPTSLSVASLPTSWGEKR